MTHFTIKQTIPDERIYNLLVSALEGGSNYWYMLEDRIVPALPYTFTDRLWNDKRANDPAWIHSEEIPFNKGGALVFSVQSEERDEDLARKEEAERYTLDREAMARGLALMAEHSPSHFATFLQENDDAETGDVFLQYCLFGEVKFG